MTRIAAAALVLALVAACTAPPPAGPASFRSQSAPIASQTGVDWGRMAGDWTIVLAPPQALFGTVGGRVSIATGEVILPLRGAEFRSRAEVVGPGRLRLAAGDLDLWVLWVDADYRTAAVGSPDGRLGFVMDRTGDASSDRVAAARDILAWMGYDPERMTEG